MIRIAVLGAGSAGLRHCRRLMACGGVAVVSIPSRPESRPAIEAEGVAVAPDLADAGPLDGVVVATETRDHPAGLLRALDSGARCILVEKPLGASVAAVADAVARIPGDVRVFVGCNLRFAPSLRRFRDRLSEIGTIQSVRIECRSYLPDWRPNRDYRRSYSARAEDGGVLRDLIHEIDYALWLYGRPTAVTGALSNTGELGIESEEQAELAWSVGPAQVTVGLDYLRRPPRREMVATGEHGTLTWDGIAAAGGSGPDTYALQAAAFVAALRGEPAGDLATLDDGLAALAVCDAARRSAASGCSEGVRM